MPLRPLTEADLIMVLKWRNAPTVRQAMYTHHEISLDEHRAWYKRMQNDPSAHWFIYERRAGVPQGVVNFTNVDLVQRSAFWGFYACPDATLGTGIYLAIDALNLAFTEFDLAKINAEVLATNSNSLRFHKKVGFTVEGCFREHHFNGENRIDVIRFGMLAKEWPQHRARLLARIAELEILAVKTSPPTDSHPQ